MPLNGKRVAVPYQSAGTGDAESSEELLYLLRDRKGQHRPWFGCASPRAARARAGQVRRQLQVPARRRAARHGARSRCPPAGSQSTRPRHRRPRSRAGHRELSRCGAPRPVHRRGRDDRMGRGACGVRSLRHHRQLDGRGEAERPGGPADRAARPRQALPFGGRDRRSGGAGVRRGGHRADRAVLHTISDVYG